MTTRFELFATAPVDAEATWAVVGDPWRLPEWTDATAVVSVDPEPLEVGSELVLAVGEQRQRWRVTTVEATLWEAMTELGRRRVGIGVRVVRELDGTRLVLAGAVRSAGRAPALRERLWLAPALRRRFDRWAPAALRAASDRR